MELSERNKLELQKEIFADLFRNRIVTRGDDFRDIEIQARRLSDGSVLIKTQYPDYTGILDEKTREMQVTIDKQGGMFYQVEGRAVAGYYSQENPMFPPRDQQAKLETHMMLGRSFENVNIVYYLGTSSVGDGSKSYDYDVDGGKVSFSTDDGKTYNVWANFGSGAQLLNTKVKHEDLLDFRLDINNLKADYAEVSAKKEKEIKEDVDVVIPREEASLERGASKYSVANPTPLQTLVMWTELESKLKPQFGRDPYSIGEFSGYKCVAKVKTCGFGSTGAEYKPKMGVDEAFDLMVVHIDYQRESLRGQIGGKYFDKLLPREQDALTSLGYNTGRVGDGLVGLVQDYAKNPTRENQEKVCDKIEEYCKYRPSPGADRIVASGLQTRRQLETAVFKGEIDGISDAMFRWLGAPTEKTRHQFEEFCNPKDAQNGVEMPGHDLIKVGDDLKGQQVAEYNGSNGQIPQDVMDAALAQAQANAANGLT